MTTTAPPPTAPPELSVTPQPSRPVAGLVISILFMIVGGFTILGMFGSVLFNFGPSFGSGNTVVETIDDLSGAKALELDIEGQRLTVTYGDVPSAQLSYNTRDGEWEIRTVGGTVTLSSPEKEWKWGPRLWGKPSKDAVLTLPEAMRANPIALSVRVDSGEAIIDGTFTEVSAFVDSGAIRVSGAATMLTLGVDSGAATTDLFGVDTADIAVHSGEAKVRLTGAVPTEVSLNVDSGEGILGLPAGDYRVNSTVDSGSFENSIPQSSNSTNILNVTVESGLVAASIGG